MRILFGGLKDKDFLGQKKMYCCCSEVTKQFLKMTASLPLE